jgi:hypothetical protein
MSLSVKATEFKDLLATLGIPWDPSFALRSDKWHQEQIDYWVDRPEPKPHPNGELKRSSPDNGPTFFHTNGGRRVIREIGEN